MMMASCGGGGAAQIIARASSVTAWSRVANDASGFDHSALGAKEHAGPGKSSRAMAMVHIAMHDAIQAIAGRYQTFVAQTRTPGASVDAAVAQAAHDVLVALYPSQTAKFDTELATALAAIPAGAAKDAGIEVGKRASGTCLASRAADGSDNGTQGAPYAPGQMPGFWRADPINPGQTALGPNWHLVAPFVLTSASQFRAVPPPAMGSAEYEAAYAEVIALGGDGIATPTARTQDETIAGIYWAYDGTPSLCAPPRLYNQIAVKLMQDYGVTDLGEQARLLALINIAMADAGICSWETKYFYNFWRPVTGIRESDPGTGPSGIGDGNAATAGDTTWTPLGAPASNLSANNFTPPFPAYVSGHATFGGALFQVLRRFFGRDDIGFTFVSDEYNGVTLDNVGNARPLIPRTFSSLSQAEEENGQSRIYLGIHWSFDKTEGIKMGNEVGNWVVDHVLKPL